MRLLFLFIALLLVQTIGFAQTVTGTVALSSEVKPAARRSPYGKPPAQESKTAEKRKIAVWLEGESPVQGSQETPVYLDQKEIQFSPRFIAIRQKEKVRVRNSDPVYHNVFSLSSVKKFDIGRRQKGEYVDVQFEKTGVIQVFCDIHSHMNAEILVVPETAIHVLTTDEGAPFSFENLAPGTYTLKAYATGYREFAQVLRVATGSESVSIKLETK